MRIQQKDNYTNFTAKSVNVSNLDKLKGKPRRVAENSVAALYKLGDRGTSISLRAFDDIGLVSVKNKQKEVIGSRIRSIPRLEINVVQTSVKSRVAEAMDILKEMFFLKKVELPEVVDKGSITIQRVKSEEQIVDATKKLIDKK